LARQLTEDGKSRVLLLESGGSDPSALIQMPAALSIPMKYAEIQLGFCHRACASVRFTASGRCRRTGNDRLAASK